MAPRPPRSPLGPPPWLASGPAGSGQPCRAEDAAPSSACQPCRAVGVFKASETPSEPRQRPQSPEQCTQAWFGYSDIHSTGAGGVALSPGRDGRVALSPGRDGPVPWECPQQGWPRPLGEMAMSPDRVDRLAMSLAGLAMSPTMSPAGWPCPQQGWPCSLAGMAVSPGRDGHVPSHVPSRVGLSPSRVPSRDGRVPSPGHVP